MKQMKTRKSLWTVACALVLLVSGCYSDEVNDLQKSIDDLKKSQNAQAELIQAMQTVQDLKSEKVEFWGLRTVEKGQPLALASLSDGRQLAVTDGGLTIFEKNNDGKVVIDGEPTSLIWTDPLNVVLCPKGIWQINDESTGKKAPIAQTGKAGYKVEATDGGYLLTMPNGAKHRFAKRTGFFYLAEGSWGKGDGELSFFSYDKVANEHTFIDDLRQEKLGETPNAMIAYGSKIYIAIAGTQGADNGSLRVLDRTGKLLKEIKLKGEVGSMMPRQLVAHEGNVYVSAYLDPVKDFSYVAKLDTIDFAPKYAKITGKHSEGLAVSGNELFICQSGQGKDNKLAVVDLGSFTEKEVVTVGYNPVNIVSDGKGYLYFTTMDVYGADFSITTPSNLYKMDASKREIVKTYDIRTGTLALNNNTLYVTTVLDWSNGKSQIKKINLEDDKVSDFARRYPTAFFAKKIAAFDDEKQELYVTQNMGAFIYRFSYDGKQVERLRAKQQNGAGIVLIR